MFAALCGNKEAVALLLRYGADCTLQNDNGETVMDIASHNIRKLIAGKYSD